MDELKIVVTNLADEMFCKCQFCDIPIAAFKNDIMVPSAEECYKKGNIPIPNFGWFCSQKCALGYEKKFDIHFNKTEDGKVDYLSNLWPLTK